MCGQVFFLGEEIKYLGVLLASDLSCSPHVAATSSKSSFGLGLLQRNLKKAPVELKEQAYRVYVRSILEYACPIWSPHLKGDSADLERVNRRAIRYVSGDFRRTTSVTALMATRDWQTLEERRREAKLVLLYKIVNDKVAVSLEDINLELSTRPSRNSHKFKFREKRSSTANLQNFFTHRCF